MLSIYKFFLLIVTVYSKIISLSLKILNNPVTSSKQAINNFTNHRFLGYKYTFEPEYYAFFSNFLDKGAYLADSVSNTKEAIFRLDENDELLSLQLTARKQYFIDVIRCFFGLTYGIPNRDFKINRFFKSFYTWPAWDIFYFYHKSFTSVVLRLGLAPNTFILNKLLKNNLIFLDGRPIRSRWTTLLGGQRISLVYNRYIYLYLIRLQKLFKYQTKWMIRWYLTIFVKKQDLDQVRVHNNRFLRKKFFSTYNPLPFFHPCFLTLTFILRRTPWTYNEMYEEIWGNWLNFNSHNWRYLS